MILSMNDCMHACVHISICACVRMCVYVRACVSEYVCMFAPTLTRFRSWLQPVAVVCVIDVFSLLCGGISGYHQQT